MKPNKHSKSVLAADLGAFAHDGFALLAKCNPDAPMPDGLKEWDSQPAAGKEQL